MSHVELPNDYPSNTQAVVIMFGWLGSTPKYVKKYADQYVKRGCAVVYGTAPSHVLLYRLRTSLDDFASDCVSRAASLVKEIGRSATSSNGLEDNEHPHTPVILHYFSSGAFLAERMDIITRGVEETSLSVEANEDMKFICDILKDNGYEVLDSSPPFIDSTTTGRALDVSIPNIFVRLVAKTFVHVGQGIQNVLEYVLRGLPAHKHQFWTNMVESQLCKRQMLIYSNADVIADCERVELFMDERKKRGIDVIAKKFEDSVHVLHMKKYPKEYGEALDEVIQTVSMEK